MGYEATKEAGTPVKGRSLVKAYYGHLSMADQVKSTAKLYFKGVDDLILLKFSTAAISKDEAVELRFEEAAPPQHPGPWGRLPSSTRRSEGCGRAFLVEPQSLHQAPSRRGWRARVPRRRLLRGSHRGRHLNLHRRTTVTLQVVRC